MVTTGLLERRDEKWREKTQASMKENDFFFWKKKLKTKTENEEKSNLF